MSETENTNVVESQTEGKRYNHFELLWIDWSKNWFRSRIGSRLFIISRKL